MLKTKQIFAVCAVVTLFSIFYSTNVRADDNNGFSLIVAGRWGVPDSVKKSAGDNDAYIKIFSPHDGDVVGADKPLVAKYSMSPGEKGDHFHYYLDGEQLGSIRSRDGELNFGKLKPGKHVIALKIANSAHILIGVEKSVTVIVK